MKKAERWRIDAFEWWCWRRLLRVPWTARRSNQSILKEINPEYSHWKDWCWSWWAPEKRQLIRKDPDSGKDWGQEEKGATEDEMVGRHHWLSAHEYEQPDVLQSMGSQTVRRDLATEQQRLIGWQTFSVLCLCTRHYCITLSILGFCFWMQLSYSETVWSLLFTCLLSLKSYCLSLLDI